MNFFDAVKTCLVKYVDFTGRASRSEFWYFVLFCFVAEICLFAVFRRLAFAFVLAVLLPRIAVAARRMHDIDRSGWWLLIAFIPVLGWIVLLVWYCQRSDEHANRFGAPPFPPASPATAPT